MEEKPQAFIVACKAFFGFASGQTLMEFRDEVAKLTEADRIEIAAGLSKELNRPVSP